MRDVGIEYEGELRKGKDGVDALRKLCVPRFTYSPVSYLHLTQHWPSVVDLLLGHQASLDD